MLSDILQPSHIECEFVYRYLTLHLVSGYVMSKISFPLGISNVQNTVLRSVFSHKTGISPPTCCPYGARSQPSIPGYRPFAPLGQRSLLNLPFNQATRLQELICEYSLLRQEQQVGSNQFANISLLRQEQQVGSRDRFTNVSLLR